MKVSLVSTLKSPLNLNRSHTTGSQQSNQHVQLLELFLIYATSIYVHILH